MLMCRLFCSLFYLFLDLSIEHQEIVLKAMCRLGEPNLGTSKDSLSQQ